ncbi:MAG: S-layer homology domain-containing protein [Candidatus Absconditabacterales bacterium]
MKKVITIVTIGLFCMLILSIANASEYNGSIDSSDSISTNGLEVALPCSPSSVSNGSVNATTCVITCNSSYTLSSNQCVSNGGGGGGGGGGSISTGNEIVVTIKTLSGEVTGIDTTSGDITDSPYSNELNDAYLFAFENGITTMNTIQKADMEGELIRSHMAKIMTNYAIRILGKSPNTGAVCEFNDISNQSSEMKFYAKLVCQLGIMGLESNGTPAQNFNPSGVVTRAEFGTALSRLLYGDIYNGGFPYYTNHLNALRQANIITNTVATNKEIRGYVMLMLMRATNQ